MPPRAPEYRNGRPHQGFVVNLPLERAAVRQALVSVWEAWEPYTDWPRQRTAQLAAERYSRPEWNFGAD